jgi:hypothetical protein
MIRRRLTHFTVVPAQAGTQGERRAGGPWVPAFAGMTKGAIGSNGIRSNHHLSNL